MNLIDNKQLCYTTKHFTYFSLSCTEIVLETRPLALAKCNKSWRKPLLTLVIRRHINVSSWFGSVCKRTLRDWWIMPVREMHLHGSQPFLFRTMVLTSTREHIQGTECIGYGCTPSPSCNVCVEALSQVTMPWVVWLVDIQFGGDIINSKILLLTCWKRCVQMLEPSLYYNH